MQAPSDRTTGDDMKISYVLAIALSALATPAVAEPAADNTANASAVIKGAVIFSSEGRRIGRVDRVLSKGVSLIYDGRFIEIPLDTLKPADKGYMTSLTKSDLNKL